MLDVLHLLIGSVADVLSRIVAYWQQTVIWTRDFISEPTALARGEGTNSAGYLYPGIEKHSRSLKFMNYRGRVTMIHGWTSLISKIQMFARIGISKISNFKNRYLENRVSHNELGSNFCVKKWEESIYYGKSWNARTRDLSTAFLFLNCGVGSLNLMLTVYYKISSNYWSFFQY